MKLSTNNAVPEVSGAGETIDFGIARNGKAFRVLSDTMYKNKPGSMIRETSCNAADSHIAAGKADVPFELHLPCANEPWYSVKDFGTGLSPADVRTVFTRYFESTKDQSNDQVGAFGLGAKTPFAYTDQFTVTSIYNGVKTFYSAYVNEHDVPAMSVMTEIETDEPNGVEINVAVKPEDFRRFREEAAAQLRFFKVKPIVKNGNNFQFQSVATDMVFESDDIGITTQNQGYGATMWVIQGGVGYPLDLSILSGKISKENESFITTIKGSVTYLYFKIGEVGVTASREDIEYNKRTIANIDAKLDAIRAQVSDWVKVQVDSHANTWDKAAFLNASPIILRIAGAAGVVLDGVATSGNNGMYQFSVAKFCNKQVTETDDKGNETIKDHVWAHIYSWTRGMSARDKNPLATIQPGHRETVAVIIRDSNSKPVQRLAEFFRTHNYVTRVIIMTSAATFADTVADELREYLGGYNRIFHMSKLPLPATVRGQMDPKEKLDYSRPTFYRWKLGNDLNSSFHWERGYDKLTEIPEAIYVYVERNMVDGNLSGIASLAELGEINVPVVGIRREEQHRIDSSPEWVFANDFYDETVARISSDFRLRQYMRSHAIMDALRDTFRYDVIAKMVAKVNADTLLGRLFKMYNFHKARAESLSKEIPHIIDRCRLAGVHSSDKLESAMAQIATKAFDKLPLLRLYASNWEVRQTITEDHLQDYVTKMG